LTRQPDPPGRPQSQVSPGGMTADHNPADIDQRTDSLGHDPRQSIDGQGDIVKGPRPPTAGLAGPAELRGADDEAGRGQRVGQRPGVTTVEGTAPEAAMNENDQRQPTRTLPARPSPTQATRKPQVSDLVVTRAILERVIRLARCPGQDVSLRHDDHFLSGPWPSPEADCQPRHQRPRRSVRPKTTPG